MNMLKKVSLASAMAVGLLASGASSAATICAGCDYRFVGDGLGGAPAVVAGSYLGSLNPNSGGGPGTLGDGSTYTHAGLGSNFDDWWFFQINPAGNAQWDATFNPSSGVTNFQAQVYSITGLSLGSGVGSTCSNVSNLVGASFRVAGFCGTVGSGAVLANLQGSDNSGSELRISNLSLDAGWYGIRVQGNVSTSGNLYSGNLTTRALPEPGSLALVALGMLAAGAALRRKA